ncbi:hypothetical protein RCL1_006235 [Eukaryota sp. TZLM3-RCL]
MSQHETWRRVLSIGAMVAAVLLLVDGATGMFIPREIYRLRSFFVNLYIILASFIVFLTEAKLYEHLNMTFILDNMSFLKSSRGRAVFYIILGTLTLDGRYLGFLAAAWIVVVGVLRLCSSETFDIDVQTQTPHVLMT